MARRCRTPWARWRAAWKISSSPAAFPNLLKGGFSEQASRGIDVYQIRQPLGVVAGITPFNFPAMVPMWMFANAIACGNTFILKPSEKDPSVSLLIAELLKQAGVPDGVFNVVQGDKVAVDRLLEHPDVKAISFVGSTPVARSIYETATRNGKRVQALGGAKNHMLVLPDADIAMAADAAVSAAYGSAGERCMAISVVVAVGSVADPLLPRFAKEWRAIKIGPGHRKTGNEMGPLITREHRDRVASYVANAVVEGATVAVDGRDRTRSPSRAGFSWAHRCWITLSPACAVIDDEIFGPVLSVVRVDTYDRGAAHHQRESVRQRRRDLHARRRRGAPVPVRCRSGHGRHQRAHSRAGGLLQLWRMEGFAVRRSAHVRTGGSAVLHAHQGGHQPLARSGHQQSGPRLPASALSDVAKM